MKIHNINEEITDHNDFVQVDKITVTYVQPCDQQSDEYQEITVTVEDNGAGKYIVFETKRWAIDKPEELQELFIHFKNILKWDGE